MFIHLMIGSNINNAVDISPRGDIFAISGFFVVKIVPLNKKTKL